MKILITEDVIPNYIKLLAAPVTLAYPIINAFGVVGTQYHGKKGDSAMMDST
jgi:hypothetical protein